MPAPYKEYKSWSVPALLLQVELIRSQQGWERQGKGGGELGERQHSLAPQSGWSNSRPAETLGDCRASLAQPLLSIRGLETGVF